MGSLVSAIVALGASPAPARRRRSSLAALLVSLEGTRRLSFDADVLSLLPHDSRVIQSVPDVPGALRQPRSAVRRVHRAGGPRHLANTATRSTPGSTACAPRRRSRGSMPAWPIATRDFGWLADRQLLLLHDRLLDEALASLDAAGHARRGRRTAASCSPCPRPTSPQLVRQDPAGLFDLLRDALGGAQAGFEPRRSAPTATSRRTATAGW